MTQVAWFNFYMCWVVKYNGPHPLLQSTLVFLCVLGLKILLGCGLNMIIQMSVVLKNIVIRDSDLTTRAYSVCFPERIKSHKAFGGAVKISNPF